MIPETCPGCGKQPPTKRSTWCSDRCRKRVARSPDGRARREVVSMTERIRPGNVEEAARRELQAVQADDSWRGVLALALAQRIDEGAGETGAGFASLVKAFREVYGQALAEAKGRQPDAVDEISARSRLRRLGLQL